MPSLEQLILEKYESSNLDFKAVQYRKEKFEDFLVDVIAMANANTKQPKYIVIGVKAFSNGSKELLGISENFMDEATYQQLVNENIEPEIKLEYFPITVNNILLAAFFISNCEDPPFMLKKDYGKLKKGDAFIRKGTHQTRITRKDIDNFYKLATERKQKIEDIQVMCQVDGKVAEDIKPLKHLDFPSNKAAEKIKRILKEKEEKLARFPSHNFFLDTDIAQIGGTSYEQRSTKTLKENLKNVKETYQKDDLYYLLEERAFKINFELLNKGRVYLEDASIEIEVKASEGLKIATKIIRKPDNRSWLDKINMHSIPSSPHNIYYPEVTKMENSFRIFENVGNLKHLIPSNAFKTPIRLVLTINYPFDMLVFKIKIFGKALEKPLEKVLELAVIK